MFLSEEDANEATVHILIRKGRVFFMTFGLALGLSALSLFMINGVFLPDMNADNVNDALKLKLLSRYNTYTGAVFSVIGIICHQGALFLVPVFFMCFAPSFLLKSSKSIIHKWVPVGTTMLISILLSQSLNSVNVQFTPRTESIIGVNDLSSPAAGNLSFLITNASDSTLISGVLSTDTILRNAIQPSVADFTTTCSWTHSWSDIFDDFRTSVQFGFSLNLWLEDLLPTSVKSNKSLKFTVGNTFTANAAKDIESHWGLDEVTQIFSNGFEYMVQEFVDLSMNSNGELLSEPCFIDGGDPEMFHVAMNSSNATQLLNNMKSAFHNERLVGTCFSNISVPEITIEISSFWLSPQIKFDAVTFELPVAMEVMQQWLNDSPSFDSNNRSSSFYATSKTGGDYFTDLSTSLMGNEYAVVLIWPIMDFDDQVWMSPLCENRLLFSPYDTCDVVSNSSAFVISIAHHMTMDEFTVYNKVSTEEDAGTNSSESRLRMKNVRKVYSFTIGKLSWHTSDLAKVYGAKCEVDGDCYGLYFPLGNGDQHLVLGEAFIPAVLINELAQSTNVVIATDSLFQQSIYHADLIYPPNYSASSDSLPWNLSGDACASNGSVYINDVIQRHIYSSDPVQPAYTSGLFWLFQNAAVRSIQSSSYLGHVKLDFDANRRWISPHVSIPDISAVMTTAGCFLILIGGVAVLFWSRMQKRQHGSQNSFLSAHTVGDILFNADQFPPYLLQIHFSPEVIASREQNDDLRTYTITEMTLKCQSSATESLSTIRPSHTYKIDI